MENILAISSFILFIIMIIIKKCPNIISIIKKCPKKVNTDKNVINEYYELALNLIKNDKAIINVRKKYKILKSINRVAIVLIMFFIILIIYSPYNNLNIYLLYIGLVISVILLLYSIVANDKAILFKKIYSALLKKYNPNITYDHYDGISWDEYKQGDFWGIDGYESEDLITGNIYNHQYKISEIHAYNDSTYAFSGSVAIVQLNNDLNATIFISNTNIPNTEKNYKAPNTDVIDIRDNYITIDNEEFEKFFNVYSDERILAMRLLSPNVTQNLIDIYNETGIDFEIKIVDNILYIRLHSPIVNIIHFSSPEKEAIYFAKSIEKLDRMYKIIDVIIKEIERIDI